MVFRSKILYLLFNLLTSSFCLQIERSTDGDIIKTLTNRIACELHVIEHEFKWDKNKCVCPKDYPTFYKFHGIPVYGCYRPETFQLDECIDLEFKRQKKNEIPLFQKNGGYYEYRDILKSSFNTLRCSLNDNTYHVTQVDNDGKWVDVKNIEILYDHDKNSGGFIIRLDNPTIIEGSLIRIKFTCKNFADLCLVAKIEGEKNYNIEYTPVPTITTPTTKPTTETISKTVTVNHHTKSEFTKQTVIPPTNQQNVNNSTIFLPTSDKSNVSLVAVVLAVIATIIFIVVLLYFVYIRRKKKTEQNNVPTNTVTSEIQDNDYEGDIYEVIQTGEKIPRNDKMNEYASLNLSDMPNQPYGTLTNRPQVKPSITNSPQYEPTAPPLPPGYYEGMSEPGPYNITDNAKMSKIPLKPVGFSKIPPNSKQKGPTLPSRPLGLTSKFYIKKDAPVYHETLGSPKNGPVYFETEPVYAPPTTDVNYDNPISPTSPVYRETEVEE